LKFIQSAFTVYGEKYFDNYKYIFTGYFTRIKIIVIQTKGKIMVLYAYVKL